MNQAVRLKKAAEDLTLTLTLTLTLIEGRRGPEESN